ncbi:MAG: O-antigen ligase family protein [Cyanobacteria bacterium J06621_8]
MASLIKVIEKSIAVMGFLYLTGGLFSIFPSVVSSLIQYAVYLMTLLFLLARWERTIHFALKEKMIWILIAVSLASFFWSMLPFNTLRNSIVALQTSYFGLYIASCYSIREQIKLLAWALGIGLILCFVYTLLFPHLAIHSDGVHYGAWRATFAQKNILAQIATFSSLVFLFLFLTIRRNRYLACLGIILSSALLLLTTSKTAIIISVALLALFPLYKALRWQGTKIVLLLSTSVLLLAFTAIITTSNLATVTGNIGRDVTLTGRTLIWGATVERIRERPLLGYGRDVFWNPTSGYSEAIVRQIGGEPDKFVLPHAHNGFLDLTCDFGLLGLSLFVLSFIITYWRACIRVRTYKESDNLWPLMYLSFFFLYNLTEGSIMKHNSIFWATYVATALSVNIMYQKDNIYDKT